MICCVGFGVIAYYRPVTFFVLCCVVLCWAGWGVWGVWVYEGGAVDIARSEFVDSLGIMGMEMEMSFYAGFGFISYLFKFSSL